MTRVRAQNVTTPMLYIVKENIPIYVHDVHCLPTEQELLRQCHSGVKTSLHLEDFENL